MGNADQKARDPPLYCTVCRGVPADTGLSPPSALERKNCLEYLGLTFPTPYEIALGVFEPSGTEFKALHNCIRKDQTRLDTSWT